MTEREIESKKLLERVTMFNDAVYAIVLTLLVLELKLPEHEDLETPRQLWHALVGMAPHFLGFLLSILLVGSNWISSVNIQRIQVGANSKYLIFMVIYLAIISLTPFLCNVISNYPGNPFSYIIFGAVMELLALNGYLYLVYCRKNNFFHKEADMKEILKLEKAVPVIALFVIIITAIAFYNTQIAFTLFLVYNALPFFIGTSLKIEHKAL
jgi:uncharacterized membrane protein